MRHLLPHLPVYFMTSLVLLQCKDILFSQFDLTLPTYPSLSPIQEIPPSKVDALPASCSLHVPMELEFKASCFPRSPAPQKSYGLVYVDWPGWWRWFHIVIQFLIRVGEFSLYFSCFFLNLSIFCHLWSL